MFTDSNYHRCLLIAFPHTFEIFMVFICWVSLVCILVKPCTQMFTEALSIITKTWMQSQHPSIGQWINKLWYTQTIAHYSALNRKELPSHKNSCIHTPLSIPQSHGHFPLQRTLGNVVFIPTSHKLLWSFYHYRKGKTDIGGLLSDSTTEEYGL